MEIKKDLIKRNIAGDTVLVPVGRTVYESNGLFVLNELGAFIWDILPRVDSEEEICKAVLEEYDASPEEVVADIAEFMNKLRRLDII